MSTYPRVSFGVIVLNGEPFVRYNLRALYPFAHQIIVVEGAAPAAAGIGTAHGHSTDGTLDTLRDFKAREDPDNKVSIVTAEDEGHPDGFWPGEKDEQSNAYARRAKGDYLWQVDIDEFYHPRDMRHVLEMLRDDRQIAAMSFKQNVFWGGFDYLVDGWILRRKAGIYHRLFKWGAGYRYINHRPPTVYDSRGRDLRSLKWLNGYQLAQQGILLYHYSLVFPKQVSEKCRYYSAAGWARRSGANEWAEQVFGKLRRPYRVHNVFEYPGWLERFGGDHPPQVAALRADVKSGQVKIGLRPIDDIERLLRSPGYWLGKVGLKVLEPWDRRCRGPLRRSRYRLVRIFRDPVGSLGALRQKLSMGKSRS